jgi:hypothetical protein
MTDDARRVAAVLRCREFSADRKRVAGLLESLAAEVERLEAAVAKQAETIALGRRIYAKGWDAALDAKDAAGLCYPFSTSTCDRAECSCRRDKADAAGGRP